jgi:AcrR family transcriptional regulator
MPKGFSENEKKMIRERLLEQGGRLFAAYGLKKTTVDEVAAAAGISKGAFYLFWPSKEALFMDVVELAEVDFRGQVLAEIARPGDGSQRARLAAALRKAFTLWRTVPLLRVFTSTDFELIAGRVGPEQVEEHMRSDGNFFLELIETCRANDIPVTAAPEKIGGLLYALFFTSLHEDDLKPAGLGGALEILIELTAAYCLGEIETTTERTE